jgi:oxygen-independent coproporphyrinogen III oxidase
VTAEHQNLVEQEAPSVVKGRPLTLDHRVRAHVIERLMCDFRFDGAVLRARFGDVAASFSRRPCCPAIFPIA